MFDGVAGEGDEKIKCAGEEKLDRAAGISLSSVLIKRWVSHTGQVNQQAVKAAHYQANIDDSWLEE